MSREITYSASTNLTLPINRVAFPAYSKLAQNIPSLKSSFLGTLGMIAILIAPAAIGMSAIAPVMVPTLLGDKWLATIPIMQLMAPAGLFFALANMNAIYFALGLPRITTFITFIRICIYLPTMAISTSYYGIKGAATSMLVVSILILPIAYLPVMKILSISLKEMLSTLTRPLISSGLMYLVLRSFLVWYLDIDGNTNNIPLLLSLILIGVLVYPVVIIMLWKLSGDVNGTERKVMDQINSWIKNRKVRVG